MLQLKKRISLVVVLAFSVISYYSCTNNENFEEETLQIDKTEVISRSNFEALQATALTTLQSKDLSYLRNHSAHIGEVDYKGMMNAFNNSPNRNAELSMDNYSSYQSQLRGILGSQYNEKYFANLFELYKLTESLAKSDLFNPNSSLEDRRQYLEAALEFAFENSMENTASRFGECEERRDNCYGHAESSHENRIIGCTVTAFFAGVFSGGPGAAVWVPCMVSSGLLYDNDISACNGYYETCTRYN